MQVMQVEKVMEVMGAEVMQVMEVERCWNRLLLLAAVKLSDHQRSSD